MQVPLSKAARVWRAKIGVAVRDEDAADEAEARTNYATERLSGHIQHALTGPWRIMPDQRRRLAHELLTGISECDR